MGECRLNNGQGSQRGSPRRGIDRGDRHLRNVASKTWREASKERRQRVVKPAPRGIEEELEPEEETIMKRLPGVLLVLTIALSAFCAGQSIPYLSARVNDYAGILSSQTIYELENQLKDHEVKTSNQVAVLTIASLEGQVIEDFSIKVAETWKLGQKDKDNGVLLLISRDDKKLRIEVGDGLEGVLTDARSGQIMRHEIIPRFKNGDYDGGVRAGVTAILGTIEGTYVAESDDEGSSEGGFESIGEKVMGLGIFGFVVGIFTLIALFQKGPVSWFLYFFLMPFWIAFPLAILGTLVPFIVYAILFPLLKIFMKTNPTAKRWREKWVTAGSGF